MPDVEFAVPRLNEDRHARIGCESCGYDIANISIGGRCPECGLAVIESLPEQRIGTVWQRGRGLKGYSQALISGLTRPAEMLRLARPSAGRDTELYMLNALISAAMPVGVWISLVLLFSHRAEGTDRVLLGLAAALLAMVIGTFTIAFFALLVFYAVWGVALVTVRRFNTDEGLIVTSIASSWLVLGSALCSISLAAAVAVGPVALVLFAVGFFGGWCGYAVGCYRGLAALRFANLPVPVSVPMTAA